MTQVYVDDVGMAAAVDDAAADRQGQREADMTRNVMLSDDRHYLVAWGVEPASETPLGTDYCETCASRIADAQAAKSK